MKKTDKNITKYTFPQSTNSFKLMKHLFTLLIFLTGLAATAQTIAVQGVLRDPKGRTVDDGYYEVVFSIYDQQADGTALWSETHPSLETHNGLFVAKLGTYEVLDIAFDTTYYLGIAIEGRAEISPRMQLSLAPYALGVFGAENYFPGVGDVRIKDSLMIKEGSLSMAEGSLRLGKGDMKLDSGNLTLNGGDIVLDKEGAGISFADGTKLTTAFGGTAANLSNNNSVIIAADTDEDGVGSIDLNIEDSTHMRIDNAGRVNVRKDVLLDSGQLMAKTGNDLGFGHWNPADSTYSEVMNMNANGTVVFSGNVKAAGTATSDEDLVNLGTLNSYLAPNIPDTADVEIDVPIGSTYGGGTVFAKYNGYHYIAYEYTTANLRISAHYSTWTATAAFGQGQSGTQQVFDGANAEDYSLTVENIVKNERPQGYDDWFIPSRDELQSVFDNTSVGSSQYYWTITNTGMSTYYSLLLHRDGYTSSGRVYDQYYRTILVRKVIPTEEIIQYDDNSTLTVGALQNYLPVLNEEPVQPIGSDFGGGKVFANDDDYVYVAYPFFTSSYQLNNNNTSFTSSTDFGSGYDNTQTIFGNSPDGNSSTWEYYIQNYAPGGYTDWYIPSQGEYDSIFINYPQIMGSYTGYNLWTSSSYSSGSTYSRYAYFGSSSSYNSYSSYASQSNYYRTILIRRIPRVSGYTADDNDFVTVGFLLDKIAELEARLDLFTAEVGDQRGGGTVFAISGGTVYVAYEYGGTSLRYASYGGATSTSFGSGYSNTQNILNYSSTTTGTSYFEGVLRTTINGYDDWFIPSKSELQSIFDNTSVATTSSYYWTSSVDFSCSSSGNYYHELTPSGSTNCQSYSSSGNYVILVRKFTLGQE